jgi:proteasome lid subunit RPN8/RPN11
MVAIPVYIQYEALASVEFHAAASPKAEVGGVLLGGVYASGDGEYVLIERTLPARAAAETRTELTFTHETWQTLNADREEHCPNLQIVGWYHTHPGLGVFFSEQDQFIHRNFFADPAMVGLVVDPIACTRDFFAWRDGRVEPAPGYYMFGHRSDRARVRTLAKRSKWTESPRPANAERDARPLSFKNVLILALLAALALQTALRPNAAADRRRRAEEFARFGAAFAAAGDHQEAAREFRRAETLNPKAPAYYLGEIRAVDAQADYAAPKGMESLRARVAVPFDQAASAGPDTGRAVANGLEGALEHAPKDVVAQVKEDAERRLREMPPAPPPMTTWERFRAWWTDQMGG